MHKESALPADNNQEYIQSLLYSDLSRLIDQHTSNNPVAAEAVQLAERLEDPSRSIFAKLREAETDSVAWLEKDEDGNLDYYYRAGSNIHIADYFDLILIDTKELVEQRTEKLNRRQKSIIFSEITDTQWQLYALAEAPKIKWGPADRPGQIAISVITPFFIAANNKQSYFTKFDQKPTKSKHETPEEKLFRKAITVLRRTAFVDSANSQAYMKMRSHTKNVIKNSANSRFDHDDDWQAKELSNRMDAILHNPENEHLRNGMFEHRLSFFAQEALEILSSSTLTSERVYAEWQDILRLGVLNELTENLLQSKPIPTLETEWTILPPGNGELHGETASPGDEESTPTIVDMDRIEWLKAIAKYWSKDAYIAIANLDKSGSYDYRVAVLPQKIAGVAIEHAIAENPRSRNATYVFRAEKGFKNQEDTQITWKEVFDKTKEQAKILGARAILHREHHQENIIEFLTRPPHLLESRRYFR